MNHVTPVASGESLPAFPRDRAELQEGQADAVDSRSRFGNRGLACESKRMCSHNQRFDLLRGHDFPSNAKALDCRTFWSSSRRRAMPSRPPRRAPLTGWPPSGDGKRVVVASARAFDVPDVSRHHDEVPLQSRGCDQPVDGRDWIGRAHASPTFCDRLIDFDNAVPEFILYSTHPGVDRSRGDWVTPANSLNAPSKLTEGQYAQKQLIRLAFPEPVQNVRVGPIALPKLRQHIRVEQPSIHSSISRIGPSTPWSPISRSRSGEFANSSRRLRRAAWPWRVSN